jgi:hypothetical protein
MPFSQAQFFDVFRLYNEAVWPIQWLLNLLAIVAAVLAIRGRAFRLVCLILSMFWIWMGVAYHVLFFAKINPAAIVFGILFVAEGLIFLWLGVVRTRIQFRLKHALRGAVGIAFVVYALLLYPALGYLLGRRYPATPTFGLPCPTTIFTFGMLLLATPSLPLRVLVIPAAWSILGFSAARSLSVTEDYGLLIAGIVATLLLTMRRRLPPPMNEVPRATLTAQALGE